MSEQITTVNDFVNTRVVGGKRIPHRVGRVADLVFHPSKKRVIGFIMKRPDILWMFKRKDKFVAIDGFEMIDGRPYILGESKTTGKAAYKALELVPDDCLTWMKLPVITKSGQNIGIVVDVSFDIDGGAIQSVEISPNPIEGFLFGKRNVSVGMVKGYREFREVDARYADDYTDEDSDAEDAFGAILVSDKVLETDVEDGLAHKAIRGAAAVSQQATLAAKATGKVVVEGAVATTNQIKKTKGMFSAFRNEYKKARRG